MRRTSLSTNVIFSAVLGVALSSCSKDASPLLDASRALSTVTANEAIKLAGANKQITMIIPEPSWKAASVIASDFETALKKRGVSVTVQAVNVGDPMASDFGLKSADFFAALGTAPATGAVVSFAGAPLLKPAEFSRIPATHPPILIVATGQLVPGDQLQLARLLDAKIIQAAIIDGGDPSAPKSVQSDAAHELFAQHYRILRRPD